MFGRVPRLPVDLMFQSVLQDKSVCDYDQYVKSLSDVQSAMSVAQKNSVQEQKHQSNQYNKRVKGLPLAIGDQVLVANKGCRGKRKLADRWEPVVYTVVASKPSIHVYRICDRAGNERTVHRNLLLQVNFLPLTDTDSDGSRKEDAGTPTYSVPSQSDPTCSGGLPAQTHSDACTYIAEIEPADDEQNEAEELSQADSMSNISNVATCDDDRTASWVHSQLPCQQEPNPHLTVPVADDNTVAGAGADPSPQNPVYDSVPVMQGPVAGLNTADRYSTRFGRVIKPVCRLIESMVQFETLFSLDSGSTVIHV